MAPLAHLAWPFFDEQHRRFRRRPGGLGRTRKSAAISITPTWTSPAARWCARWATPAGSRPWCRRPMAACRKNSTCARFAPRARFCPGTTAWPISPSPCRAWAPASISLYGSDEIKAKYLPPVCAGRRHRGVCAVGTGSRLRRRRAGDHRVQGRAVAYAHRRHEDLDFQRRHRRSLRRVRAYRRGARRQGTFRFRRRRRHAGPGNRRPHRGHRAASAGDAALHRLPRAAGQPSRRSGRGLQGRHGDARYLPLDGCRRRARHGAPRLRRNDRPRGDAQSVRRAACRHAAHASRARRQRHRDRRRRLADLPRRLGPRIAAPRASRAKRRWPNPSRRKWRNG